MDLDELLKNQHEEAGEDFDEDKPAKGKEEDRDIYEELKHFHETMKMTASHIKDLHDKFIGGESHEDKPKENEDKPKENEGDK